MALTKTTVPGKKTTGSTEDADNAAHAPSHEPAAAPTAVKIDEKEPDKTTLKLPNDNVDHLTPQGVSNQPRSSIVSIGSRRHSTLSNISRGSDNSESYPAQKFGSFSAQGGGGADELADKGADKLSQNDPFIKVVIPKMPMTASVICLIINIIAPGIGTIFSSFLGLCFKSSREIFNENGLVMSLLTNIVVGLSQLATITFLLVGWFWSLSWGVYMINKSLELWKEKERERQEEQRKRALSALLIGDKGNSNSGNVLKSLFGKKTTD